MKAQPSATTRQQSTKAQGTADSASLDQMRLAAADQEAMSPSTSWPRSNRGQESGAGAQQLTRRTG